MFSVISRPVTQAELLLLFSVTVLCSQNTNLHTSLSLVLLSSVILLLFPWLFPSLDGEHLKGPELFVSVSPGSLGPHPGYAGSMCMLSGWRNCTSMALPRAVGEFCPCQSGNTLNKQTHHTAIQVLTPANLFTIRPVGVVSKKLMGARRILLSSCL